jgi:hypothetical protein
MTPMKLVQHDAELYFSLMWALQYFVKQRLNLLPEIRTIQDYADCGATEKLQVRQALFEQRTLIDDFIHENPDGFPDEHLQIIRAWKQAIVGEFYIERILKRYTIFIASDDTVYGVLGLYDDFDDIFHKSQLPRLVKAVLLPFKGTIIYDGLLQGYNVFFGGGIRGDLKEIYLRAKQQGRIVESLEATTTKPRPKSSRQPQPDWSADLESLAEAAKKLRGGSGQPALYSPAFSLIKASLEFARFATDDATDLDRLWKSFDKIERTVRKLETTLYRAG